MRRFCDVVTDLEQKITYNIAIKTNETEVNIYEIKK